MKTEYSAHPALASEQLQRAAVEHSKTSHHHHHNHHRRHNSTNTTSTSTSGGSGRNGNPHTPTNKLKHSIKSRNGISEALDLGGCIGGSTTATTTRAETTRTDLSSAPTVTDAPLSSMALPDRTYFNEVNFDDGNNVENNNNNDENESDSINATITNTTTSKDCVDCAPSIATPPAPAICIDGTDHLQHRRFSRTNINTTTATTQENTSRQQVQLEDDTHNVYDTCTAAVSDDGCTSGLSSAISSPSPSTVSSPLSSPSRIVPHFQHCHQHCCQKSPSSSSFVATSHHHQHHHHNHSHPSSSNAAAAAAGGCKKFDQRLGPSPYRQLLPFALCILSFATVFSVLIVYMDTTEIRHQQFRLNMSRDYELYGVAQDDPTLIAFLREIHMRKYPMHFSKNGDAAGTGQNLNFSAAHQDGLTPEMANYAAGLVGNKMNGAVIQSLPGSLGQMMTAPWLSETLNWAGVIVEPEPRRYFTLRKQNAPRPQMQVLHACISPNSHPKEVTIHNEESEVRINSLFDEETSWFNSRVKCFPLYTIMLACNRVEYDLLSLGVHGYELQILQTLPFDKIRIEVISIHLLDDHEDVLSYIQTISKFLTGKSYKLQKKFGRNYFYQRINSTSRTRKRDILLLTTP